MKIKQVRVRHTNRSLWGHLGEREKTLPLVTPLDIYPQFQETRGSWFWDSGLAVVQIEPIFNGEPEPSGGCVSMEHRPGLGVTVNEAILD